MRAFALVVCMALTVMARPDVGGYNYNGLQQQNQLILPQNGHIATPHVHQQLPAEHSFANFATFAPPQTNYGTLDTTIAPNGNEQLSTPVVPEETAAPLPQALPLAQQDSYNMAYHQSSLPHESGYPYAPQPTKVHKHIFVHVPPKDFEDEDVVQPRVHHQVGPKQKHYKIVFIKAPSAPAIRAPIVPPPPQNEEKTLIYVLHKKPEAAQDIVIPAPEPTKPSKPEVYFIKYKTKKEEAPVYGPPPASPAGLDMDPRSLEAGAQYAAPAAPENFNGVSPADLAAPAPITTIQPVLEEQQTPQLVSEVPSEVYGTPTMAAIRVAEPEPTLASFAPAPSNQYLTPEVAAPNVNVKVPEEHKRVPATNYGPPSRFFIKKKK